MLYAGKSIKIYNYSIQYIIYIIYIIYRNIVKILYIWDNQQETLLFINNNTPDFIINNKIGGNNNGSSETIRNNINILYKEKISKHIPKHYKPLNNDQLGYYLAGLIDGDGNFNNQNGNLTIIYDLKDISSAYWLKDQIKYGSVIKIKNKNSIKYVISHSDGLIKILELINGKLKTKLKYNQVINNLLNKNNLVNKKFYLKYDKFIMDKKDDFFNHWLSGFIDADGSLQIKIINKTPGFISNGNNQGENKNIEIRLKLQITQKEELILSKIRLFLCNILNNSKNIQTIKGCYIGKYKHLNKNKEEISSYYLETTSFQLAKNVICYLNKYPLISYKYLNYLYFYKSYLLIQDKKHLTLEGQEKIKIYKDKMRYKN